MKEKQIQIPKSLFDLMLKHFYQPQNVTEAELQLIDKGIMDKVDRFIEHELFTEYKTALTQEQRDSARENYLLKRGIKTQRSRSGSST